MKNNKSALLNNKFISKSAANELVISGCVIDVPFQPYNNYPLRVTTQNSGKWRLTLDLGTLSVKKERLNLKIEK